MDYKDTLLYASLMQVSTVSEKAETAYWKKGIYTLDDLAQTLDQQLTLFGNGQVEEIDAIISDACRDISRTAKDFEKKTGKKDWNKRYVHLI